MEDLIALGTKLGTGSTILHSKGLDCSTSCSELSRGKQPPGYLWELPGKDRSSVGEVGKGVAQDDVPVKG